MPIRRSDGHTFRSPDGVTWQRVYDGVGGQIGCGLEVFDHALYAVNYDNQSHSHGRILCSDNGQDWTTVYDSGSDDLYLRHIVAHGGSIYALATRESASEGKIVSSPNGLDWTIAAAPTRFFRGVEWQGDLYLSSTTSRSNGPAGLWRFAGGSPQLVHQVSKTYVTELSAWDGALWAGTSDGWKEATGNSSLLMSLDGQTWATVCSFPEAAAWSVAPLADHLYVGTWEYGSNGTAYDSLAGASAVAGPGWAVFVRGGAYQEPLIVQSSGTPGAHLVFARYQDEVPTITGASLEPGIDLSSRQYVVIDGLLVDQVQRWLYALDAHHNVLLSTSA